MGFLWEGNESQLLEKIEEEKNVELFLTEEILEEITDVITRERFVVILQKAGLTAEDILTKIFFKHFHDLLSYYHAKNTRGTKLNRSS